MTSLKAETLASIVVALPSFLTAVLSAKVAASRRSQADQMLRTLKEETELADALPEGSVAQQVLRQHADFAAPLYVRMRVADALIKVDKTGIILGIILITIGAGLAWFLIAKGGWLLWLTPVPLAFLLFGIVGFFYELSGGKHGDKIRKELAGESPGGTEPTGSPA
ncbi:hypothetical protein HDA40_005805 [Hamadaea flava]|uniref:Uncharacterized protein n=1 Tax=Hamadaea flava TaxID=1742688 RepID=A0ABV8LSE0_9ACTN|nr:hypothetical protein [Hamadaea flava]MCP2327298.1 hypothetical protein [Hamadaea flava]